MSTPSATDARICPFEWNGTVFDQGDPVRITGENGTFTFHYAEFTSHDKPVVTVYGQRFRYFYAERIEVVDPSICTAHPKYQGLRRPRTGCGGCWQVWESRHSAPEVESDNPGDEDDD